MAIPEILMPQPIEVKKFKPSQVSRDLFIGLNLVDLITKGYGFEGNELESIIRAASELSESDERSAIYLAVQDGKAVGSLVTTKWTPEDTYGKKFWSDLKQRNRSLYRRLSKLSPLGLNISGITTHPDFRRQGLTERLYKYVILDTNPSFVTGITKTPEAVVARANNLRRLGYRTFYGNTEVTPDKADFYTNVHEDLLDADIKARWDSLEETLDGSDVYYIQGWLPKDLPDTAGFPDYIQKAFESVTEAQKAANDKGDKKVAIKTLISVRNNIRLRAPETEDLDISEAQLPLGLFGENQQS